MKAVSNKTIGIVVSIFNEEEPLPTLIKSFQILFDKEPNYTFKVYLVENGSSDLSRSIIQGVCEQDSRFSMLVLSRNFRMDGALTAGLNYVREDACVLMAGDMQDPPEEISKFLRLWEQGYEHVYAIITKRNGTKPLRRINSKVFYLIANRVTNGRILRNVSDFRLVDRKVYEAARSLEERNRFVRGIFAWIGFNSIGVEMERPQRVGGESKASTFKVIDLALKGIFAHTLYPLKMITWSGITLLISSMFFLLFQIFRWVHNGVPFAGYGTIIALMLFGFGTIVLFLGVISEYLGLVYEEVKNRPNYIVSNKVNIESGNNEQ